MLTAREPGLASELFIAGGIMGYLAGARAGARAKARTRAKKINQNVLKRAALYATTLSSFNVEGFGVSKTASLALTDVDKRMRQFAKFIAPH